MVSAAFRLRSFPTPDLVRSRGKMMIVFTITEMFSDKPILHLVAATSVFLSVVLSSLAILFAWFTAQRPKRL